MRLLQAFAMAVGVLLVVALLAGVVMGFVVFAISAPMWMSISMMIAVGLAMLTAGFYL